MTVTKRSNAQPVFSWPRATGALELARFNHWIAPDGWAFQVTTSERTPSSEEAWSLLPVLREAERWKGYQVLGGKPPEQIERTGCALWTLLPCLVDEVPFLEAALLGHQRAGAHGAEASAGRSARNVADEANSSLRVQPCEEVDHSASVRQLGLRAMRRRTIICEPSEPVSVRSTSVVETLSDAAHRDTLSCG